MSTLSATISNVSYPVKNAPSGNVLGAAETLEVRGILTITIIDLAGTFTFTRGMPITVSDSATGAFYNGYIGSDQPSKYGPASAGVEHVLTCFDRQYYFDKGANTTNYLGWYAGDIATDFVINQQPGQEGATVAAGLHRDTTAANFNQGILSNTVGALNVLDGDLELSPAGSNVTITEATTADFSTGTLTNVQAVSNTLTPTTQSAVAVTAQLLVSIGDNSATIQIWSGSKTAGTLDTLHYDIWIASTSPAFSAGIDFVFNDGSKLSGQSPVPTDQNNISASPISDLSGYAKDTWYSRSIALGSANNGKVVSSVNIVLQGDSTGTYAVYLKNIYLQSASGSPFFSTSATATNVNPPSITNVAGYVATLITTSVVQVFDPSSAYRISTAHSIDAVQLLRSSLATWEATTPGTSGVSLQVSYDGNAYLAATNGGALPALPSGANVAGLSVTLKESFTCGSNPSAIPAFVGVQVSLLTSWNTTKSDIVGTYGDSTQWNTGTLSGTSVNANGDLTLGTLSRNWSDNAIINQTFFPSAGGPPTQSASSGAYVITVPGVGSAPSNFALSRLEFAGAAQDFVAEWDMKLVNNGGSGKVGLVYRSTGWTTFDLNFGYLIEMNVSGPQIDIGYGSNNNNAIGTGTFTSLGSSGTTVTSGTTYHFKLVVIGSRHRVYFNNSTTALFDVTDSTYPGSGNIGFRGLGALTNVSTAATIDNFTLTPATLGSWQAASTSLSTIGTVGSSVIAWLSQLASGAIDATAIVQTSIDGGTTWLTATNGGAIPGLPAGTNVSSVSLLTKIILYSTTVVGEPIIQGLVWRVLPTFPTVSGTRSTAPLGIDTMVRSNVTGSWGTSFDGQSYTASGTGTKNLTSNEAIIANTTGDVHMILGSRTGTDLDGTVRLSLSASTISAGVELRYTDTSNFYRLSLSTTTISIVKKVTGTTTTLNSVSISLSTGAFYYARFRVAGTALQARVWASGTLEPTTWQASATDSALSSGGFGLYANGTGTASFDHFRTTQYPDPALSLAPVLPRLGSSSVSWNSVVPTNTTLAVKTSLDGVSFSTATSGSAIPGLNSQPDPVIDVFTTNTSANYTNTNKSGGSTATVTYDTTNNRITLSGGSGGLYLNSTISASDIDVIVDMDESDAGGMTWRNQGDGLNYYELGAYDDSASGGFTNALRLYKVLAGTRSLLGSASTISWPRSTVGTSPYKTIRVTMLSGTITVYFDGAVMQTYTDGSPLGAGKVGLRNDGGASRYYQLRIQQQGDYVSGTPAGDVVTADFVYTQATLSTTDPSVTPQLLDLTTSARSPDIATGALIPQLHDPSKPFASTYDAEMTSLAQASGGYWWHVDQNGAVTFAERHAKKAPFCLYSTDLLNKPVTSSGVTPTRSADTYRNQVIVTNTTGVTGTLPEQKIADGTATSWNMAYPLYSAPTIAVAGVTKTVGVKGVDTGKDFYWQAANNTITQDSGAAKIPSGYILIVTYVGQFADQVTRNNLPEQAARKAVEGGTGIVVAIVDGQGMLSSNAITYADGLLARNSNNDTVELTATTTRPGLAVGMVVPVFLPEHQLNNRQLLIMKLTTSGYQLADGTTRYEYAIDASDGSNLNNWAAALFG